jgi:aspartate/methionine/tyrosine aminotransferase
VTALTLSMPAEVEALVDQLAVSGSPVIRLHTDGPPAATPTPVVEAASAACRSKGMHQRRTTAGQPELREAIAAKTTRDSGLDVSPAEVVVTSGRQQSTFNALSAVVDAGDEVLLPAPYWPTHPAAVELTGGHPVTVPAAMASGFKVTVDQLRAALSPRTKALLFCSPSDPTGAVYTAADLRLIGEWANDEGLWVITDEIYEHLVYDSIEARSLPALVPAVRDRCIVLNSVAKAYSMTGWRIGWLIAHPEVAEAIAAFQSLVTFLPGDVTQVAALAALEAGLAPVEALRAALGGRRSRLFGALAALPGVEVVEPSGGFHAFPSVEACLGGSLGGRRINTTLELSAALIEHAGVAVLPGEAFGRRGHLRISFAVSDESLEDGIARIAAGLDELMKSRT